MRKFQIGNVVKKNKYIISRQHTYLLDTATLQH